MRKRACPDRALSLPNGNVEIFIISHVSLLVEKFRLPPSLARDIPGRWGGNIGAVWGPVCDNIRGRTLQEWVRVMLDTPSLLLGALAGLQEVAPPRGRTG
jgi:hypothetical protein